MHDDLIIDEEFQAELGVNSDDVIARIETKLVKEGCIDAIRVWESKRIIVDGMTRFPICQRLGIKFDIEEMEFEDRAEAKLWIIENQLARRDLTDTKHAYLIGKAYNERVEYNKRKPRSEKVLVKDQLAEETGKSPITIVRLGEMAEVLDDLGNLGDLEKDLKDKILDETASATVQEIKEVLNETTKRGRKKKVKAILDGGPKTVSLGGGDDELPKIYDGLGNVVENVSYHEVFVEIETFNEIIRGLRGYEAKMKRLAGTRGGSALHVEELSLRRVRDELDCRIPWCICSTCKGSKTIMVDDNKRIECPDCASFGFMTKFNYERKMNKGKKK